MLVSQGTKVQIIVSMIEQIDDIYKNYKMTMDVHDKLLETVLQEYKILTEYERLQSEDLSGVYVTPSYENPFLWFGVIFVRVGIYKDGIFRFTITLPSKFPNDNTVPVCI